MVVVAVVVVPRCVELEVAPRRTDPDEEIARVGEPGD